MDSKTIDLDAALASDNPAIRAIAHELDLTSDRLAKLAEQLAELTGD